MNIEIKNANRRPSCRRLNICNITFKQLMYTVNLENNFVPLPGKPLYAQ